MRVTNAMLSNNMLLGLDRNMTKLNTLYEQMNTLKKIQRPSDDPIILGRSLKLRLNVLETEQYQTNVGEAKSWMEISEKALGNTHKITDDIRYQCVQASNGPLEVDDRQKILTTIEQLKKQLIQEANANYAGRNVFGGYKTDKKVLFDKDTKMEEAFKFEQTFTKDNVETVTYKEEEYHRIRLPYGDVDFTPADPPVDPADPNILGGSNLGINGLPAGVTVRVASSTDIPAKATPAESFYYPKEGEAYFLKDTGELIMHKNDTDKIGHDGITISYGKTNFKAGDPNPELFFDVKAPTPPATDPLDPPIYTASKPSQKIEYEIGIGTKLNINVLGKDIYNPMMLRDIDELSHVLGVYDTVEKDINGDIPNRHHKETINLSKLFSNSIGNMDKALKAVSGVQADLGSRMKRLDLTGKRLGDDEISFTELLSRTEDVDVKRAYTDFNTQFAVYQSALQATARVVQPTLMDFLR